MKEKTMFMVDNFHTMKITILLKDTHVGKLMLNYIDCNNAHDVCVMCIVTITLHYILPLLPPQNHLK